MTHQRMDKGSGRTYPRPDYRDRIRNADDRLDYGVGPAWIHSGLSRDPDEQPEYGKEAHGPAESTG